MALTNTAVARGALAGALTMTEFPASKAWGSDAARIASGQLNGTMMVTGPTGRLCTTVRLAVDASGSMTVSAVKDSARPSTSFHRISNTFASTQDS